MKKPLRLRVVIVVVVLLAVGSCNKSKGPIAESVLNVSLCEIYENPTKFEGKSITVSAAVTQLPRGTYLYPTSPCQNGFRFVKLDGDAIQSGGLEELASSKVSSSGRKEFEAEITGVFDSKYAEDFEAFRFRIVPSVIKQSSPVKTGRPLGAG